MPRQLSGVVVQSDALDSIFEALNQLIDFLETYHSDYFDLGEYVSHEEVRCCTFLCFWSDILIFVYLAL